MNSRLLIDGLEQWMSPHYYFLHNLSNRGVAARKRRMFNLVTKNLSRFFPVENPPMEIDHFDVLAKACGYSSAELMLSFGMPDNADTIIAMLISNIEDDEFDEAEQNFYKFLGMQRELVNQRLKHGQDPTGQAPD